MRGRIKPVMALLVFVSVAVISLTNAIANTGEIIGEVYGTDILVTVNGVPIPAYSIDGKIVIVVEDLTYYGFRVVYSNYMRALYVSFPNEVIFAEGFPTVVEQSGEFVVNAYRTDIRTIVDGVNVPSFAIDGKMCVAVEELGNLVPTISYERNETGREISLSAKKYDIKSNSYEEKIRAFVSVLLNETAFYDSFLVDFDQLEFNREDINERPLVFLNDYLECKFQGTPYDIERFMVIDMTGNGTNDIVLHIYAPIIMGTFSLVLEFDNGEVYGNIFSHRLMTDIKKDGTYSRSFGFVYSFGTLKLHFSGGMFWNELLSESLNYNESSVNDFNESLAPQNKKGDAIWSLFSTDTISEDLRVEWLSNSSVESVLD